MGWFSWSLRLSWSLVSWSLRDMAMFVGGSFLVKCLFEGQLMACLWLLDRLSDSVVPSGVHDVTVQLSSVLQWSVLL